MLAKFGRYRAIAVLAEGGMGIVYLAERDDRQFEQRVAVKVLRADADADLLRRLFKERQILASLNHPTIARLMDAGIVDGRPYLVMEYVDGRPIDVYCEALGLDARARVELFLPVVRAVQHAHNNLIIHRDLKPSNILVTADGNPKLVDFGIAGVLNDGVDEGRTTSHALTPAYASPEQIRAEQLTTATDVYSLGLVLQQLLPDEIGDLSAIAAKASAPTVEGRYASADALAQDLEAYLAGGAVLAHNGGAAYRARKFVRQHKAATLGGLLLTLAIVGGTGVALWQASVAGAERDVARAALQEAEQTSAQRAEVGGYLIDLFRTDTAARSPLTADDLLRRGVRRAQALENQPVLQARMFDIVGQMHHRIGRYVEAESLLTRAHYIRVNTLHAEHPDVAESLIHLSRLYRGISRWDEARRFAERALRIHIASLPEHDLRIAHALIDVSWYYAGPAQEELLRKALNIYIAADADIRLQLGALYGLATNLRRQGKPEATVQMARDAVALARRRLGADAPATAYAMIQLADQVRDIEQDLNEAEQLYRKGLTIQIEHEGPNSMGLIHAFSSLAVLMQRKGDYVQAETFERRVLDLRMAVAGPQHIGVARTKASIARILAHQGRAAEALQLSHEMLTTLENTVGRTHMSYADGLSDLAAVNAILGNWEAAITHERAARAHETSKTRHVYDGVSARRLGRHLVGAGRFQEAEPLLLHSLQFMIDYHGNEDHPDAQASKRALFELYTRWGRARDAAQYRIPPPRIIEES